MRLVVKTIAAATCLAGAVPAVAGETASGSARITARVPEVCDLAAAPFTISESGQVSGRLFEFCNSNRGYQVLATHRPLEGDERAFVNYAGRNTALSNNGLSTVAFRSGQRVETVDVVIDAREIAAPITVAFTMAAI